MKKKKKTIKMTLLQKYKITQRLKNKRHQFQIKLILAVKRNKMKQLAELRQCFQVQEWVGVKCNALLAT